MRGAALPQAWAQRGAMDGAPWASVAPRGHQGSANTRGPPRHEVSSHGPSYGMTTWRWPRPGLQRGVRDAHQHEGPRQGGAVVAPSQMPPKIIFLTAKRPPYRAARQECRKACLAAKGVGLVQDTVKKLLLGIGCPVAQLLEPDECCCWRSLRVRGRTSNLHILPKKTFR